MRATLAGALAASLVLGLAPAATAHTGASPSARDEGTAHTNGDPAPAQSRAADAPTAVRTTTTPVARWSWRMPTVIKDTKTWVEVNDPTSKHYLLGGYFKKGPDGIPDEPMKTAPHLKRVFASMYGNIPADGKHRVVFNAKKSAAAGVRCDWTFEADRTYRRSGRECRKDLSIRLPEGRVKVTLVARRGKAASVNTRTINVRNLLVFNMGDSYSSGDGFPPFTEKAPAASPDDRQIKWDEPRCVRSRWSGMVRTALNIEKASRHSNVTFVDVACAGARIGKNTIDSTLDLGSGGILYPQKRFEVNGVKYRGFQPPQIDQVRKLSRGQKIDSLFFTIGGNDVGFYPIVRACFAAGPTKNCYAEVPDWATGNTAGVPLYRVIDRSLGILEDEYAEMAKCFTPNKTKGTCKTYKVRNGKVASRATASKPVLMISGGNVVQGTYPDLMSTKENGKIVPCGYSLDLPTSKASSSWAWKVAYQGRAGVPTRIPSFPGEAPANPSVIIPANEGMSRQIVANGSKYGWSIDKKMVWESRGFGTCAGADSWLYPAPAAVPLPPYVNPRNTYGALHPNEAGQQAFARTLTPVVLRTLGLR